MKKFLKFLGFSGDDEGPKLKKRLRRATQSQYYDDDADDDEEQEQQITSPENCGIIFFKGLPTEADKMALRDALLEGKFVILDLSGISTEQIEAGRRFITFMGGVSFANKGEILKLGATLFGVSPRAGQIRVTEGNSMGEEEAEE